MKKGTKILIATGCLSILIPIAALTIKAGEAEAAKKFELDKKAPVGKVTVMELDAIDSTQYIIWDFMGSESDSVHYDEYDERYEGLETKLTGNIQTIVTEKETQTRYEVKMTQTIYQEGQLKEVEVNKFDEIIDDSSVKKPYVIVKK